MMEMNADYSARSESPLIIELVGLAGAGKTTLLHALNRRNEEIKIGAEIALRKLGHLPVFVRNAPLVLPTILQPGQQDRWFTWEEIKYLVYLKAWPHVLEQQAAQGGEAILLDHGPVFKMATLHAFGPDYLKTERSEAWWNQMFRQWASTVDMVIWLDAPNPILEKRINSRSQRHAVKGKSETEALRFLGRYRTAYERILARLMVDGGPTLFQFDTSRITIEQVVDEVLRIVASHGEGISRTVTSPEPANIAG
jgi:thymidylate kinase